MLAPNVVGELNIGDMIWAFIIWMVEKWTYIHRRCEVYLWMCVCSHYLYSTPLTSSLLRCNSEITRWININFSLYVNTWCIVCFDYNAFQLAPYPKKERNVLAFGGISVCYTNKSRNSSINSTYIPLYNQHKLTVFRKTILPQYICIDIHSCYLSFSFSFAHRCTRTSTSSYRLRCVIHS